MKKLAGLMLIVLLASLLLTVPAFADQPPWAPPSESPPEWAHGDMGDRASDAKCDNSQAATMNASDHAPWWRAWGLWVHAGPGPGCPG